MSIESLYNDTMDVQRRTNAQDAIGGQSGTWANISTGNACRIRLLSAKEQDVAGRRGVKSTHRLYCGPSVTIAAKDRVVSSGTTYDVDHVYSTDGYEDAHHLQVDIRLRE